MIAVWHLTDKSCTHASDWISESVTVCCTVIKLYCAVTHYQLVVLTSYGLCSRL